MTTIMGTNSLNSAIMQLNAIEPKIGMKCCTIHWTDRYPATVTKIMGKNTIEVTYNKYKILDHYGEIYKISDELLGNSKIFTKRKNGRWVQKCDGMKNGMGLSLDTHNMRIDPSF